MNSTFWIHNMYVSRMNSTFEIYSMRLSRMNTLYGEKCLQNVLSKGLQTQEKVNCDKKIYNFKEKIYFFTWLILRKEKKNCAWKSK